MVYCVLCTLYGDNTLQNVDAGAVEHSGVWIREHGDRGGNPDGGNTGDHSATVTWIIAEYCMSRKL